MKKSRIPSKVSSNSISENTENTENLNAIQDATSDLEQNQEVSQYTYEQVINALSEVGVCGFAPPGSNNLWNTRQDHLQVLKTIQLLTMKRKQLEDETESKKAKVIEPLTVRTKGNQALLDEAQAKKKFLLKEIELNRQKLESLKQKKADQILQHEKEIQEIKQKISELNKSQKVKIKCSFSQSNMMTTSLNNSKEEAPRKKRKSEVIQNTSKTLFDDYDEDSIILQDTQKKQENKMKDEGISEQSIQQQSHNTISQPELKTSSQPRRSSSVTRRSKSARNSLSIEKIESNTPKNRKSLGQSSLSSSMKLSPKENYEEVHKRMLALFQAKRKSRNSLILSSKNDSTISLNDNENKNKTQSSMQLNDDNKLSMSLPPQIPIQKSKTSSESLITPDQNQKMSETMQKDQEKHQPTTKNKSSDHHKPSRTKIPKRPRTTYTQC